MTAAPDTEERTLLDVSGEPFYLNIDPGAVFKDGKGIPLVTVTLNGGEHNLPVSEAWQLGTGLFAALAQVQAMGMFPGNVTPTIGFRVVDSRELMLSPAVAYEVSVMLLGAAISSIHDLTVAMHFHTARGWSFDEIAGLFAGMKPVNPMDFLMPAADGQDQADDGQDQASEAGETCPGGC